MSADRPWIRRLDFEKMVDELSKTHEIVDGEPVPITTPADSGGWMEMSSRRTDIELHLRDKYNVGVPPPAFDPASVPPVSEKIKNTPGGYTMAYPLHAAAIRGTIRDVDAMLRSGKVSLADRDGWGQTPLMAACSRYGSNSVKLVEWMLLRGGADPSAVNVAGLNARRYAYGESSTGEDIGPDGRELFDLPSPDDPDFLDPYDEIYEEGYSRALGALLALPEDCPDSNDEFFQFYPNNRECQHTTEYKFVFGCRRAVYPLGLLARSRADVFMVRTLLRHPTWLPVLLGPLASLAHPFCSVSVGMTDLWNEDLGPMLRRAFLLAKTGFGVITKDVIEGWRDDDISDDEEISDDDATSANAKRSPAEMTYRMTHPPEGEEHDWLDPTDSELSGGDDDDEEEDDDEDGDGDSGGEDDDDGDGDGDGEWEENEMFRAISGRDLDKVRELIAEGWDLEEEDGNGYMPLHCACEYGDVEIIKLLIAAGSDVDQPCSEDGMTPLHVACMEEHLGAIEALIDAGADINAGDYDDRTPLFNAIESESIDVVGLLLRRGARRSNIDGSGLSAKDSLAQLAEESLVSPTAVAEITKLLRTIKVEKKKKKEEKRPEVSEELRRALEAELLEEEEAAAGKGKGKKGKAGGKKK
jgi:hypothetical protein